MPEKDSRVQSGVQKSTTVCRFESFTKQKPEMMKSDTSVWVQEPKSPAHFRSRASHWPRSPPPPAAPRQSPAPLPPRDAPPRAAPPPLLSCCAPYGPSALPAACACTQAPGHLCARGRLLVWSTETRRERRCPAAAATETQGWRKKMSE